MSFGMQMAMSISTAVDGGGNCFVAVHSEKEKEIAERCYPYVVKDKISFVVVPESRQNKIQLGQILTKEQVQQFNQELHEVT